MKYCGIHDSFPPTCTIETWSYVLDFQSHGTKTQVIWYPSTVILNLCHPKHMILIDTPETPFSIPHSTHGNGIFTYTWTANFLMVNVGKSYISPMDPYWVTVTHKHLRCFPPGFFPNGLQHTASKFHALLHGRNLRVLPDLVLEAIAGGFNQPTPLGHAGLNTGLLTTIIPLIR